MCIMPNRTSLAFFDPASRSTYAAEREHVDKTRTEHRVRQREPAKEKPT